MNNSIHICSRSEHRGHVRALLTEEAKLKRQRTNTVNIQITFISWLLELIGGLIILPIRFIEVKWIVRWLILSDIVVNFILIPIVYVLNNDVNKGIIVAEGWLRGFRMLMNRRSIVAPEQNNEEHNPGNPNLVPVPIPTISGNIAELENRDHRRGNNLRQATSDGFTTQRLFAVADATGNVPTTRNMDRSESNKNSLEDAVTPSGPDSIDLDDKTDEIETIPLDDIGEPRYDQCEVV